MPKVGTLPSLGSVENQTIRKFARDEPNDGVEHVILHTPAVSITRLNRPIPESIRKQPVDLRFTSERPTIDDLVEALGANGIQVALQSESAGQTSFDSQTFHARSQDTGHSLADILGHDSTSNSNQGLGFDNSEGSYKTASLAPVAFPRAQTSERGLFTLNRGSDLGSHSLPFVRYHGTVGGLIDALDTAGLVASQEGEMIVLSDSNRYSVTVPQNDDIVTSIAQTLHDLGATNIVTSVDGGKIVYSAAPDAQAETIGPFLRKATRNLSTIALQIAVVSVAINDKAGNGFDWSQFSANLNQAGILATNAYTGGTIPNPYTNALATTGVGSSYLNSGYSNVLNSAYGQQLTPGASGATANQAFNLAATIGTGKILGVATLTSVSGAIQYLSTYGTTKVAQDINLRTISGRVVTFRSGDEIPYVKGVGIGSLGSSGTLNSNYYSGNGYGSNLGTVQTDTVKTGIEVDMMPRYDSDNQLVVIDMKMELSQLVEFLQLNAGSQFGTLTQPHTAKQELTDILRVRAGQTAVIGGLQSDSVATSGNEPTVLRGSNPNSPSFGATNSNVQRNALFIILRPTVVVYDPSPSRS